MENILCEPEDVIKQEFIVKELSLWVISDKVIFDSGSISSLMKFPDINSKVSMSHPVKSNCPCLFVLRGPSSNKVLESIFELVNVEDVIDKELEFWYLMKEVPDVRVRFVRFMLLESICLDSWEMEIKVELVKVESITLLKVQITVKVGSPVVTVSN
jgi:hypothetical protein